MVAAFVLVTGILLVLVIGAVTLAWMGMAQILTSLVPLVPCLVTIGTFLLILTEMLLFFGGKEDRRVAWRDLSYLVPTCIVSGGLWYLTQRFLWQ